MTESSSELDAVRNHAIVASLAGFPFLLVLGCVWIAAGGLSYLVPRDIAVWIYPLAGVPGMFGAMALERRLGYLPPANPDPLVSLSLQIVFVQVVAFPAVAIVWSVAPSYMPVAFAAVVGAHFLPFQWLYRTRLYGVLGVVVAAGPYLLGAMVGEKVLHYTGFFVGAALLVGAVYARSHARATWLEYRRTGQPIAERRDELLPARDS
jgi:hypothetical protein